MNPHTQFRRPTAPRSPSLTATTLKTCGPFARLVLEATYEATSCAAILNSQSDVEESSQSGVVESLNPSTGNNRVFLTLVGGGAFGNEPDWILKAMKRALSLYEQMNLDIAIVSYGSSNPDIQQLAEPFL